MSIVLLNWKYFFCMDPKVSRVSGRSRGCCIIFKGVRRQGKIRVEEDEEEEKEEEGENIILLHFYFLEYCV